jgi:glyoxylase-like metal-dependent hydrolase (beta-lactamase superfamily II)
MPAVVPLCLGWMSNDASALETGASGTIRYPVPGYAVLHERGVLLFDTGLHAPLAESTDELGPLAEIFHVELTDDDLVERRLASAGIDPESITHVVNSHLHFDHCGRNSPFPSASTVLQRDEWSAAHAHPRAYTGSPLDEVAAGRVELVDGVHDVFGDGTVVCVPTPGHTAGHQSLLVRASADPGAASALLVGDACYLRRMLVERSLPPFGADRDRQLGSYDTLATYERQGTALLFSHDVTNWDRVPEALTRPR